MSDEGSVRDVIAAINRHCHRQGGVYAQYSCKTVSWDDATRGEIDGKLSQWGSNITDTRLWEKNGTLLYTVRPDNWNEKLGKVSSDKIALVICKSVGDSLVSLEQISLKDFLKNIGKHGSYAGLYSGCNLTHAALDSNVSVRFQTTFLPVANEKDATIEFATEAYNYNTRNNDDPKNLIILCTTQGTAIQQDGAGAQKLLHHSVDSDGVIHRHYLEAQRTEHKVGGEQKETSGERSYALARGKAVATDIGLRSMGSRFNVLMTIQIPLEQTRKQETDSDSSEVYCDDVGYFEDDDSMQDSDDQRIGQSNAARVSKGSEFDTWDGLGITNPERHPSEHVTVTIVLYNTVAGGVPSEKDVMAAIDDMENLYASCEWTGKLKEKGAEVLKAELTVKDVENIEKKLNEQPYGVAPVHMGKVENLLTKVQRRLSALVMPAKAVSRT